MKNLPLKCPKCNRRFRHRGSMQAHMNLWHHPPLSASDKKP